MLCSPFKGDMHSCLSGFWSHFADSILGNVELNSTRTSHLRYWRNLIFQLLFLPLVLWPKNGSSMTKKKNTVSLLFPIGARDRFQAWVKPSISNADFQGRKNLPTYKFGAQQIPTHFSFTILLLPLLQLLFFYLHRFKSCIIRTTKK